MRDRPWPASTRMSRLSINVLGAANKSLRHYDAAIASLTEAIRLKPDYAEAYSNLGAAFHDIGRYEEAVTHYRKAARYDPYFSRRTTTSATC